MEMLKLPRMRPSRLLVYTPHLQSNSALLTGAVVDVLLDTGELAVVLVTVVLIVVLWEVDSGLETGVVVETAAAGVEEDATSVGVGSEVDAAAELVGIAGAALAALAAAASERKKEEH